MTNPDKEFVLRGGESQQTAIHNRIAAIERIKFLSGVDLRDKSANFLKVLDVYLWKTWLKSEPKDKKIDEEFCQRSAEFCKKMEGQPVKLDEKEYAQAKGEYLIPINGAYLTPNEREKLHKEADDALNKKTDELCKSEMEDSLADKQFESDKEVSGTKDEPKQD